MDKLFSIQLLMLVTTPRSADKAAEIFNKNSLPVQYCINAQGTASSEMIDILGLGSIDKKIFVSAVPKQCADMMLTKLHYDLHLSAANSGIAFTIPLTGANKLLFKIMQDSADKNNISDKGKDDSTVTQPKYSLIVSIVDRGFSTKVMDAARQAGARGGTVIHSRQFANEDLANWGISFNEEKDIVLILALADNKINIMHEISEKCGMHSEARGTVLSLPIDGVMGLQK